MKKVIYVADSFHTTNIVNAILETFPSWEVYKDTTHLSSGGSNPMLQIFNSIVKSSTERETVNDTKKILKTGTKVDIFVFSAKLIDDGAIDVTRMKEKHGTKDSIAIAISSMEYFLEQVKELVDFTGPKYIFQNGGDGLKAFFKEKEIQI